MAQRNLDNTSEDNRYLAIDNITRKGGAAISIIFTVDDNRLTERVHDVSLGLQDTRPLGMSLADFLSFGNEMENNHPVYSQMIRKASEYESLKETAYYLRLKEFVDLCIEDPALYSLDTVMFFLHLRGASIPEHRLEYTFDPDRSVEDLVSLQESMSFFEQAIRGFSLSNKNNNAIISVYTCDGLDDLCIASLYHLARMELTLKRCNNCGHYFVALRRSDSIYCDRQSPFRKNKTCKVDGPPRAFEKKAKKNTAAKLHRNLYAAKLMLAKRNPDISHYKESFDQWKAEAKSWKADLNAGRKSEEEYLQWLIADKSRR